MQGKLKLSYPTLADLDCTLIHLDEGGCTGYVMFQEVGPDVESVWKRCLTPQRPLRIKIESHPTLGNFEIDGVVYEIKPHTQYSEIKLRFLNLTPAQRELLHHAVSIDLPQLGQQAPVMPNGAIAPAAPTFAPAPIVAAPAPAPAAPPQPTSAPLPRQRLRSATFRFEGGPDAPRLPGVIPTAQLIRMPSPSEAPKAPAPAPRNEAPEVPQEVLPPVQAPPPQPVVALAQSQPQPGPASLPRTRPPTGIISLRPPDAPAAASSQGFSAASLIPPRPQEPAQGLTNMLPRVIDAKKRIGLVLIQMGYLTEEQIEDAVKQSRIKGQRLGRYLVGSGLINADILCRALALQSGLPVTNLADAEIGEDVEKLFPFALLMRHSFIPFDDSAMFVCVAVATPLTAATLKELERTCHKKVEVFLAREDVILKHLTEFRKRQHGSQPRRFLRYDYQAPVSFQYCSRFAGPTEEKVHAGRTQNVSEGGMLVVGPGCSLGRPDDLMRRGICLRLIIHNEQTAGADINALCRFKAIQEKNGAWWMGLELLEISAEDRRRLKELCVKAMLEQMKKKA